MGVLLTGGHSGYGGWWSEEGDRVNDSLLRQSLQSALDAELRDVQAQLDELVSRA